jgi:hypothetical protein
MKSFTGTTRKELEASLECPVCLEICRPPKHIMQCPEGHLGNASDEPFVLVGCVFRGPYLALKAYIRIPKLF